MINELEKGKFIGMMMIGKIGDHLAHIDNDKHFQENQSLHSLGFKRFLKWEASLD